MKTYIIDLDGTMYSGNTNIDGAREFIDYLHLKNLPYIFINIAATLHLIGIGFFLYRK